MNYQNEGILETPGQLSEDDMVREGWIKDILSRYLGGLIRTKEFKLKPEEQIDRESFTIGQLIARSEADIALNRMASRFANANDKLALMLRERDDTIGRIKSLERDLLLAASSGDNVQEASLRQQIEALEAKSISTRRSIEQDFPKFSSAAEPTPMSVEETQTLLRDDEALVLFVPFETFLDSWVITKNTFKWASSREIRVGLAKGQTAEGIKNAPSFEQLTARLRQGLDLAALQNNSEKPFDLEKAYELYETLFGSFEGDLAGENASHHCAFRTSHGAAVPGPGHKTAERQEELADGELADPGSRDLGPSFGSKPQGAPRHRGHGVGKENTDRICRSHLRSVLETPGRRTGSDARRPPLFERVAGCRCGPGPAFLRVAAAAGHPNRTDGGRERPERSGQRHSRRT